LSRAKPNRQTDKIVQKTKTVVLDIAKKYRVDVLSLILYGSRAKKNYSFDSDYDFFIILGNKTSLLQYTQFIAELRLKLGYTSSIKFYSNTLKNFKYLMRRNPFLGSFCYIVATEGIPLFDHNGTFVKIKKSLSRDEKVRFANRCLIMSQKLGSPKWVSYWKEKLRELKNH